VTTHEKSLGPLYFAIEKANRRLFFPVVGQVTEMSEPWRRGKALVFPTGTFNVLAIGWWTQDIQDDIAQDFAEGNWPDWMSSWEAEDTETLPGWMQGRRTGQTPGPSKVERGPEEDTGRVYPDLSHTSRYYPDFFGTEDIYEATEEEQAPGVDGS
jgi:hypothetical protein